MRDRSGRIPAFLLVMVSFVPLAADAPPDASSLKPVPAHLSAGMSAISGRDLRAWVGFLAANELGGRESGQLGYDIAARFCASVLQQYGVQPAGGGADGYFQEFHLLRVEVNPADSFVEVADLTAREKTDRFRLREDFVPYGVHGVDWQGPWVFVGPGDGPADGKPGDLEGVDLERQIPILLPPRGRNANETQGVREAGGRRAMVISDRRVARLRRRGARDRLEYLVRQETANADEPEILYVTTKVADRILQSAGWTVEKLRELEEKGERLPTLELDRLRMRAVVEVRESRKPTRNVIGRIEGSDPALRHEVVVIGAHLDHVGTRGEDIFNGADDNASGSAGVLALGRAFMESARRPRRSILLILYGAEEKGLLGSRYFVDHPTVPLRNIVAKVNLDMIGRNEERDNESAADNTNSVHVVGTKRSSVDLHDLVVGQNDHLGLSFEDDEERVFGRSDQFVFAQAGVPVVFLFTGFHKDYHRASDTVDKVNFAKMVRIVRLAYLTAFEIADREGRVRPRKRARF